jgi:DNA-binding response OmpR family regulator
VGEKAPLVPFIFVSGTLGEETAIETLMQGATDCVLKSRLSRLVPAVHRALREAEERAARRQAEDAVRQRERQYRALLSSISSRRPPRPLNGSWIWSEEYDPARRSTRSSRCGGWTAIRFGSP